MELRVIGSSSAGNAYILDGERESLLIECGIKWRDIQSAMDYNVGKCAGCVISHEHGDHSKSIHDVIKHRIPVYTSAGTASALSVDGEPMVKTIREFEMVHAGQFDIMPFAVQHDAAEPFGYLIRHPESGIILFATDTYYLKYTFPGINHMMIECNYKQEIIDRNVEMGILDDFRRRRTIQAHLSLETLLEILNANDITGIRNIVLVHLSPENGDAKDFEQIVREHTGKNVVIAKPGVKVDFNYQPF